MDLSALDRLLDRTPVVVQGLQLASLAYLRQPADVCDSLERLACSLDDPSPCQPRRILSFDADPRYIPRFPVVTVEHDPFTSELNRVLFEHYDFIYASMLTQAQVADRIVSVARRVQTVVLVLLDGLSFADCRDWPGVEPCLAVLPTVTRVGFPAIVNDPPLAARVFNVGLTRRVGFTYWNRGEEGLTKRLFFTIGDTRRVDPSRPNAFAQVLDWLGGRDVARTYMQVVYSALDEYAEGHRGAVPRQAVLGQIRGDLEDLLGILQRKGEPAALFAVADHGLLWKDAGHSFEYLSMSGARHVKGHGGPGRGRRVEADGQSYWVLDYPQLGRSWRKNEQGVHGGVSFEECIVPFIQWEANVTC